MFLDMAHVDSVYRHFHADANMLARLGKVIATLYCMLL